MSKYTTDLMRSLGMKGTCITFGSPKKVLVKYSNGKENETFENVTAIQIIEIPTKTTSIEIDYKTPNGEGSMSSSIDYFDEFIILD